MAHMLIRHRVQDFKAWKSVYDGHKSLREAAGLKDLYLWQNIDNSSEVVLLFEATDVDKAKEFAASADLKDTMRRAGVLGQPDIAFLAGE